MLEPSTKNRAVTTVAIALAANTSAPAAAPPVVVRETISPVASVTRERLEDLALSRRLDDLIRTCPTQTIPTVTSTPQQQSLTARDINCVRPDDVQMIDVYKAHNAERATLGYQPLRWNPLLAQHAQTYANQLAQTGQLAHASREGRGIERENLSKGLIGWNPGKLTRSWFDEKRYFKAGIFPDVSLTGDWYKVGHYSQIIWPTTTDIGCGRSQGNGFSWLVCRYSPGGNKDGKPVGQPAQVASSGGNAADTSYVDTKVDPPDLLWRDPFASVPRQCAGTAPGGENASGDTKAKPSPDPFDIDGGLDGEDLDAFVDAFLSPNDSTAATSLYFNDPTFNKKMDRAALVSGPAHYGAYGVLDFDMMKGPQPWAPSRPTRDILSPPKLTYREPGGFAGECRH